MRAEFSEFTYGFSLVSELASALGCAAVPIFPSLKMEGKYGGGFDVKMEMGAVPLFLQFKLSEHLKTNIAKEAKHPSGVITAPYRRFYITSSITSMQHALLVGLGSKNEHVYYCAPNFYQTDDLNYLWGHGYVSAGSVFVQPSEIGNILDEEKHAICFNTTTLSNNTCYVFSDPNPLKPKSLKALRLAIEASLRGAEMPLRELVPKWSVLLDESRSEGERLHREQVDAIKKLREEKRLAAIDEGEFGTWLGEVLAYEIPSEMIEFIVASGDFDVRSRIVEPIQPPTDPEMLALRQIGQRAATEFHSQMFVLQRLSQ